MHSKTGGALCVQALLIALAFTASSCSDQQAEYESKRRARSSDGLAQSNSTKKDSKSKTSDTSDSTEALSDQDPDSQGEAISAEPVVTDAKTEPVAKKPKRVLTELDAIAGLPTGADQLKVLCSRPSNDRLRTVLCGPTPPAINSLVDLQSAIGLGFNQNSQFALTGHSSSLVSKFVTPLNPRAIIFTPNLGNNAPTQPYVAMGFTRGEQFVEIIANDPNDPDPTKKLKFFLVHFQQECNSAPGGCTNGDFLTPAIESNWTGITVYEDEDLKNTLLDCKHCHQPAGPTSPKILRMQELRNPWTHFMRNNTTGGQQLLREYNGAKSTAEVYAGIPGNQITNSDPADLEKFVRAAGFGNQPNEFPTREIERNNNRAAWDSIFNFYSTGRAIAVPYFQASTSDPVKLEAMSASYKSFQSGTLAAKDLPDIRDTLKDADKWAMGLAVKPGTVGPEILIQACSQCHNSSLDQSLSRARFNVDLTKMSAEEIEIAVERIMLPENDPSRMPPSRFRDLTEVQKADLILHLRGQ